MAYTKENRLKRIIEIQKITLHWQGIGLSNTQIYKRFIKERFRISKRTFDEYLGIPAQRDLLELQKRKKEK